MKTRIRIFADGSCTLPDGHMCVTFYNVEDIYRYIDGDYLHLRIKPQRIIIHRGNIPLDK